MPTPAPSSDRRPAASRPADPLRRAIDAAARLRAAGAELAAALDEATAAGLLPRVRVTEPLGAREGWRVDVQGAGW